MHLPERLRAAITASGKSQKQISEESGISSAGLNNYLRGKYSPDVEVAAKLAEACLVSVAFLVGEVDEVGAPAQEAPQLPTLKIAAAVNVINRPLDDLADDVRATPQQLRSWIAGKSKPTPVQLAGLFNELARAASSLAGSKFDHDVSREHRSAKSTGTDL